jgi:hypothetical protein
MTKVQVSVVHDHAGRILSVTQFTHGVRAMVLGGQDESVLVTTVDHEVVPELIHLHKVDIERNRLIDIAENVSGGPSDARHDRDALASMLLPRQDRD